MSEWKVIEGDSRLVVPTLTESIDALITDPPYGIRLDTDFNEKNLRDYDFFMNSWGVGLPFADFNADSFVDGSDYDAFMNLWEDSR